MEKKGKRAGLYSWLTKRYQLVIRNEENFAEKTTVGFNYAKIMLLFLLFFMICLISALVLLKTFLSIWLDPSHALGQQRSEIIDLREKIDSLIGVNDMRDRYINDIKIAFDGGQTFTEDSIEGNKVKNFDDVNYVAPIDSIIKSEYGGMNISPQKISDSYPELQTMYFISPVDVIDVSQKYNIEKSHYGIELITRSDEHVKAITDGIVVSSDWTTETGYVITIQHKNSLLSVYKHNSRLLKKNGDVVSAGDLIAVVGNSGELTSGPHLHFEMWYEGSSLNPEYFISF